MISVGIDVSKEKSMVCVLKPYGEVLISPYEVKHTESEMSELVSKIKKLEGEVKIIMEATGAYHFPPLSWLKQAGLFVSVINPLLMKKYASNTLRKGKTDKIDSFKIANYGINNWFDLVNYQPSEKIYEELKMLGRQYSHYINLRVSSKLALTNILDKTMPKLKTLLSGKRSDAPTRDKLCDFVEKYWHFDNITQMEEIKFISDYREWAKEKGHHRSESKAIKIYALAKNGIPTLSSTTSSTKMLVLEAVRILQEINKTLEIILTQMKTLAEPLPEYQILRNMPGVGEVLAPRLIAEIGNIKAFHNGSALIAYAGIDSPPFESGNFIGTKRRISKRGSSLLRKTGYEVMKCLKTVKPTKDSAVYDYMIKKESEGKPKKVAKIAALNKFLRIYYARVKEIYINHIAA